MHLLKDLLIDREGAEAIAAYAIDLAKKNNSIVGADVLFGWSSGHSLSLRDGEPEENTYSQSTGISVRTISSDGQQGIAAGSRLTKDAVAEIVEWSCANCRASEPMEGVELFKDENAHDEDDLLFDAPTAIGITQEERSSICLLMTDLAKQEDKRVVSVRSASWTDGTSERFYANSEGIAQWKKKSGASCGVTVMMSDGESYEMGGYGRGRFRAKDLEPERYAKEAVLNTARLIGGEPVETGVYSILLDAETATEMIGEVGDLFCSSDVIKGRSMMKGRLGELVASSALTVVDDARAERMSCTRLFDGEGVPTRRVPLIEKGVAKNYLYNLQYASIDGASSTGSGTRGMTSIPDVATSNLIVDPGKSSFEDLVKSMKNGIIVYELLGTHTIDPVSGSFSLGIKGVRVKDGRECGPVAGVTMAGDLISFLKSITAVGCDVVEYCAVSTPSILVEGITVAGL